MRKYSVWLLILALALILCGCGDEKKALEANQYYIYYIANDFSELKKEVYQAKTKKENTRELVIELLEVLQKGAKDSNLLGAFDAECKMVDFQLTDRKLLINFDVSYSGLIGVEEILHRAAIVKTVTQIDGVDVVEFLVDNQPLVINKNAVGYMKGDDFIESAGRKDTEKTITISMFYANADGTKLVEVPTKITYDSTEPLGSLMVEKLLKEPQFSAEQISLGLQKTIPDNTVLNGMTIRDNICYVDFSKEFRNIMPNITNEVTIYSVVNLLAELPKVNKVQFTINGERIMKFGNMDFSQAFERNLDVVDSDVMVK